MNPLFYAEVHGFLGDYERSAVYPSGTMSLEYAPASNDTADVVFRPGRTAIEDMAFPETVVLEGNDPNPVMGCRRL